MGFLLKSCTSVGAALATKNARWTSPVIATIRGQGRSHENRCVYAAIATTLPLRALAASASMVSMMSIVSSGVAPGHRDQPSRTRS